MTFSLWILKHLSKNATHYIIQYIKCLLFIYVMISVLFPPQEPVKRILALTETCLVERDPASYNIVTIKPFGEVK